MSNIEVSRRMLRRCVARDIATTEKECGEVLDVLERLDVFGNWDAWELEHRPVNVEELEEIVWAEIYSA